MNGKIKNDASITSNVLWARSCFVLFPGKCYCIDLSQSLEIPERKYSSFACCILFFPVIAFTSLRSFICFVSAFSDSFEGIPSGVLIKKRKYCSSIRLQPADLTHESRTNPVFATLQVFSPFLTQYGEF